MYQTVTDNTDRQPGRCPMWKVERKNKNIEKVRKKMLETIRKTYRQRQRDARRDRKSELETLCLSLYTEINQDPTIKVRERESAIERARER